MKTDNGWLCTGADYNDEEDFYFVDTAGNRMSSHDYAMLKQKKHEEQPRCFTGWISNVMDNATIQLTEVNGRVDGIIYDKRTKQTQKINCSLSSGRCMILLGNGMLLMSEGSNYDAIRGRIEGKVIGEGGVKVGDFAFWETSLNWEESKQAE